MEQYIGFEAAGKTLRGILHLPEAGSGRTPAIILCHGFTGNKIGLHRIFVKAARYFQQAGYAVLRFDYSGCGDSDGDHSHITINDQVTETLAALEYVRALPGIDREAIYLAGLSMGGAVAALTTAGAPGLAGLILWAPVTNMYNDIRGIVGGELFSEVWSAGSADYLGFALGRPFLESLQVNYPLQSAANFQGPALIIHGTGDEEIPYQNAGLYQAARKALPYATDVHLIPGADHTFSALKWEEEVINVTLNWLKESNK